MLETLAFHHVGVVTSDLAACTELYRALGYRASDVFVDPLQRVSIVLCTRACPREGEPMIEIISPEGPSSPAAGWQKRIKAGPYHTCYEAPDLEAAIEALRTLGFAPLGEPVPAVAFEGRRVVFSWSALAGLVELVESAPDAHAR